MKIAIIGSGIAGLTCAHLLDQDHDVTVFESGDRVGGHTNTVDVTVTDNSGRTESFAVDTGFIVFNEGNYPNFITLLDRLGVASQHSEMSFSVMSESTGLEYRGTNLNTLYAQRRNILSPSFTRMLFDIIRFNRAGRAALTESDSFADDISLREFVEVRKYSKRFVAEFLIPFGSAIWSADPATFLEFPAATYFRFMDNHGLLGLQGIPTWRTVTGGSREYVRALTARLKQPVQLLSPIRAVRRGADPSRPLGIEVVIEMEDRRSETFDAVVLACHSGQSLSMLADATIAETEVLGDIKFQPNTATLHTDSALLPRIPRARASWNYHLGAGSGEVATLTYWMNKLQSIDSTTDLLVTLNRSSEIKPETVLAEFGYEHPVFDAAAIAAQKRRPEIQGLQATFFAGAYWGFGFHEDGVNSALDVCSHFGVGL
ncbi:MAG: FAD-dependent oxidoreductase [Actinomycetota bacterium]